MSIVSNAERQYLLLVARRVLNLQRDAKARGEQYHDLTSCTLLACGLRAKLEFREAPAGYQPVVTFKKATLLTSGLTAAEIQEVADQIAGVPMDLDNREVVADQLSFFLKAP